MILRRTGEVGALVTLTAPAPVLSMADLRELELRAEIDEADIAGVAVARPRTPPPTPSAIAGSRS
jgi:hypothetical protein